MPLRVTGLSLAVICLVVCFCGQNKRDAADLRKNDNDTLAGVLGSVGAVDTNNVDGLSSQARQEDGQSVSAAKDIGHDSKGGLSAMDSFFRREEEMRSPAAKRKWLEERFPSIAKALDGNWQASGESAETYPGEINCIIDSAIPEFSQWEEFKYRPDSPMMGLLYFTSSPIRPISFRLFKLSGKSSRRACVWVEIWKMKSSGDARKIDTLTGDDPAGWEMEYGSYSPKSHFIFNEYFILINGCSYEVDRRVFGIDKHIRKRCFNCAAIEGTSPDNVANKYSCHSDKVIFGQNDKDW